LVSDTLFFFGKVNWYLTLFYGVFDCEKKVIRKKYVRENKRREKHREIE
jgi:hypothetical protein